MYPFPIDFRQLKKESYRNSLLAALALWIFMALLGGMGGAGYVSLASPTFAPFRFVLFGMILGLFLAFTFTLLAFARGERTIQWMGHLEPLPERYQNLVQNIFIELSLASGIAPPVAQYFPEEYPNAFAYSGGANHPGYIALSRGLLEMMEREELMGILAHEFAHLKHKDVQFSTMTATLYGILFTVQEFLGDLLRGFRVSRILSPTGRIHFPLGPALIFILLAWISVSILSFLGYLIILFASRNREWLSDLTAVEMTRNPLALAHALEKIAAYSGKVGLTRGLQHLYFVNPFRAGSAKSELFSTHPPIQARIALLYRIAGVPLPNEIEPSKGKFAG